MPPLRGGVASTFLTECFTSTEPSRRPIPSISFSFRVGTNDNVIILRRVGLCNEKIARGRPTASTYLFFLSRFPRRRRRIFHRLRGVALERIASYEQTFLSGCDEPVVARACQPVVRFQTGAPVSHPKPWVDAPQVERHGM